MPLERDISSSQIIPSFQEERQHGIFEQIRQIRNATPLFSALIATAGCASSSEHHFTLIEDEDPSKKPKVEFVTGSSVHEGLTMSTGVAFGATVDRRNGSAQVKSNAYANNGAMCIVEGAMSALGNLGSAFQIRKGMENRKPNTNTTVVNQDVQSGNDIRTNAGAQAGVDVTTDVNTTTNPPMPMTPGD